MWRRWGTKPTLGDDDIIKQIWSLRPQLVLLGKFQNYNFCLIIIPTYAAKFKKILRADPKKINCRNLTQAIYPQQVLLGNFQTYNFCPLLISNYTLKFQKNPSTGSWDIKLSNFGPKCDQIAHLPQNQHFLGNSNHTNWTLL